MSKSAVVSKSAPKSAKSPQRAKTIPGRPRKAATNDPKQGSLLDGLAASVAAKKSEQDATTRFVDSFRNVLSASIKEAISDARGLAPTATPDLRSFTDVVSPDSYAGRFRDDPATVAPKRENVRYSGNITGHVMHIRGEQRFQIDLTDELTLQTKLVMVPAVLSARVKPIQRTVAFREAIKLAGWSDRAELTPTGKVKVSKLEKSESVRVTSRDETTAEYRAVVAPSHSQAVPVEQLAEAESEMERAVRRVKEAKEAMRRANEALAAVVGEG